jgi:hypothetical protein
MITLMMTMTIKFHLSCLLHSPPGDELEVALASTVAVPAEVLAV